MKVQRGFTLIELIVACALAGIIASMAIFAFSELKNPSASGASLLMGFFKKARGKAMNSTKYYYLYPVSARVIGAKTGPSCDPAAATEDTAMRLQLPTGASLSDVGWSVCYDSRGLSDSSVDIQVRDASQAKTVQVVLGGSVRVL